ncbi:MAG TPA: N-acetyl-D-Glu racemase DgcA [Steroidobacteraceae bacterium]|jgi:L-alanine-DL-glutamate epimerase-like enolase superfamily enzyme|nr:N-acetyl-D-Glu racemase DgcA [Steroidobacteraceae bacterium]
MQLGIEIESWRYKVPFRVSRGAEEALAVVVVTLTDADGRVGRGEAAGVDYDGETVASMSAQLESARSAIGTGVDRAGLARILPAGGARNAVDCALWDLAAKQRGVRAWDLAQIPAPRALTTAITLGIDTDEAVTAGAQRHSQWPLIKVKVDGARHIDVVRRVHAAAPGARLIVDPNQAWNCALLNVLAPELARQGVVLIEQPVPRGEDGTLRDYRGGIRLAADESVDTLETLAEVSALYQVVNVKLDKTGGLTEALALARGARERGLGVMVGCMAGTSLAMAPGMVVAQLAEFVDLDGPLLHAADRPQGIRYDRGRMELPSAELWG